MAWALHGLGLLAAAAGDLPLAAQRLGQSLAILHERGERANVAAVLAGQAGVAVAAGQPARAARLVGAAAGLLQRVEGPPPPSVLVAVDRARRALEAAGPPDAGVRQTAAAEGEAMTLDEAVAYALEDVLDPG